MIVRDRGLYIDYDNGVVVGRVFVYDDEYDENGRRFSRHAPIFFADERNPLHLSRTRYNLLNDILGMMNELREKTHSIYCPDTSIMISLRKMLRHINSKHSFTPEFKLALLYLVLDMNDIRINPTMLVSMFNVEKKKFFSLLFSLRSEIYSKRKAQVPFTKRIIHYVEMYAKALNIDTKTIKIIKEKVLSKPYPNRFTPQTLALALIIQHTNISRYKAEKTTRITITKKVLEFVKQYYT
ncbi:MAG: hypothetical protein ACP5IZ_11240 [Thermoprotei archaeon]